MLLASFLSLTLNTEITAIFITLAFNARISCCSPTGHTLQGTSIFELLHRAAIRVTVGVGTDVSFWKNASIGCASFNPSKKRSRTEGCLSESVWVVVEAPVAVKIRCQIRRAVVPRTTAHLLMCRVGFSQISHIRERAPRTFVCPALRLSAVHLKVVGASLLDT